MCFYPTYNIRTREAVEAAVLFSKEQNENTCNLQESNDRVLALESQINNLAASLDKFSTLPPPPTPRTMQSPSPLHHSDSNSSLSHPTKSLTQSYDTYNSCYASIFLLSEPLYNEPKNKAKERKCDSAEPKPSMIKGGVRPWVIKPFLQQGLQRA
jgi:hypothetical protein